MEKPIKITKKLKFDFYDLMREVDTNYEFTLRDVLRASVNSKIPLPILCQILNCNYINEYWEEAKSKKFKNEKDIEYLELGWIGNVDDFNHQISSNSTWQFYGVSKKGFIPEDLKEFCTPQEITKMKKEGFQQTWAIELSPIYTLTNFPIKICNNIKIETKKKNKKFDCKTIDIKPSISLIELLYWIFWELSFFGSPKQRNNQNEELKNMVKNIKKDIENPKSKNCFKTLNIE